MTQEQEQYIKDNFKKITQKQIAKDIGMSEWMVSKFIKNKCNPNDVNNEFFYVDLQSPEHTWLI